MNKRPCSRIILSAVLGLASVFSTAVMAGGGDPPSPPPLPDPIKIIEPVVDPIKPIIEPVAKVICRDIPNPVVEGCKAEIKCYTGPLGGAWCSGQVPKLCSQSSSVEERAEAAVKMAVGAAVCKVIAPGNQAMMVSSVVQMLNRCEYAASDMPPPPSAVDQFCSEIQSLPDRACSNLGPATVNICKPILDW